MEWLVVDDDGSLTVGSIESLGLDDPGTKEPPVFGKKVALSRLSDTSSENDCDGNLASPAKDLRVPAFSTQRGVDWGCACKPSQVIGIVKCHQSSIQKKSGAEGPEETSDNRTLCGGGKVIENENEGDESLDAFEEGKPDEVSTFRVLLPGSLDEPGILGVTPPVPMAGTVQ
jgi:hypothetical protein